MEKVKAGECSAGQVGHFLDSAFDSMLWQASNRGCMENKQTKGRRRMIAETIPAGSDVKRCSPKENVITAGSSSPEGEGLGPVF
jgi:hypothetical protein